MHLFSADTKILFTGRYTWQNFRLIILLYFTIFSKEIIFFPWTHEKTALKSSIHYIQFFFQHCQSAQTQPKSQILFHKNSSPRDLCIMTLTTAVEGTLRYQLSSWMMCDICFEKESKGHHGAFFYYMTVYSEATVAWWPYIAALCYIAQWVKNMKFVQKCSLRFLLYGIPTGPTLVV